MALGRTTDDSVVIQNCLPFSGGGAAPRYVRRWEKPSLQKLRGAPNRLQISAETPGEGPCAGFAAREYERGLREDGILRSSRGRKDRERKHDETFSFLLPAILL